MGKARGLYKVVRCRRCGWLQLTTAEKATTCKRCGARIELRSARPLAMARSAEEAREMLVRLKARRVERAY